MSEFYDIDGANAKLPELRDILLRLLELRGEVIKLRDRILELNAPALAGGPAGSPAGSAGTDDEAQRLALRMKGLIDQMEAAVIRLDQWGIQLREIETGLIDFPALVSGRPVWLCWRLGEEKVEWWHEITEGFEQRRRIEDLV